ncbi:MAG: hypothetical protein ACP5RQ_02590 [Candidatus Micrarchaeia archaeon]
MMNSSYKDKLNINNIYIIKQVNRIKLLEQKDQNLDLKKQATEVKNKLKILYRICSIYNIDFKKFLEKIKNINNIDEFKVQYESRLRNDSNNKNTNSDEIIQLAKSIKEIKNDQLDKLLKDLDEASNKQGTNKENDRISKDIKNDILKIKEKLKIREELNQIINNEKLDSTKNKTEKIDDNDDLNILFDIIDDFTKIEKFIKQRKKEYEDKEKKIQKIKENLLKTTINLYDYNEFLKNVDIVINNSHNERVNNILKIAALDKKYFNIVKNIVSNYNCNVIDVNSFAKLVDIIAIFIITNYADKTKGKNSAIGETFLDIFKRDIDNYNNTKTLTEEELDPIRIKTIITSLLIIFIQLKDINLENVLENKNYKRILEFKINDNLKDVETDVYNIITNYINERYKAQKNRINQNGDLNSFYNSLVSALITYKQ